MKGFLKRKLKERSGMSNTMAMLFLIPAFLSVFYVFGRLQAIPIVYDKVVNYTNQITREIEIYGSIDDEINQKANELAAIYGFTPEITYDAEFIGGTNHIQIRDEFSVTVKTNVKIVLLDGSFMKPITVSVPISDEKVGISEVLWK